MLRFAFRFLLLADFDRLAIDKLVLRTRLICVVVAARVNGPGA